MKTKNKFMLVLAAALLTLFGGRAAAQKLSLEPQQLTIAPGEEVTVKVNFSCDAENPCSGFSCYVILPEGLSYVAMGDNVWATFGDKNPNHIKSATLRKSNNKSMVLNMASITSENLVDDGLTIKVKADETLAETSQIKIADIAFAKSSTDYVYPDDLTFDVTRGIPTAISGLEAGTAGVAEIYSLSGVRQQSFVKGHVNIIRNTNGKTAKVLSK